MRRISILLFLILLALPCTLRAQEEQGRALTFDDLISLGRIGDFEISPDGEWIAFETTWFDNEANSSNTDIYLVPAAGGDVWRFVRSDGNDYSPRWSPDRKFLAFVSDRDGSPQIWIIPADGGEARRVTDIPTGTSGPLWSPDGRSIAFTSNVFPECGDMECNGERLKELREGKVEARLIDHLLYRHWNHWRNGRWSHLFVTDIDDGRLTEINSGQTDVPPISLGGDRDYDFAPRGDELCFTMNTDSMVAVSTNNDLFIKSLPDGVPRAISSENRSNDNNPRYSPDGKYILYRAQMRPGFEADRYRLMLYDRRSGEVKNLTERFDYSIGHFAWGSDSRTIYFSTEDRGRRSIGKVTIRGEDAAFIIRGGYDTNLKVMPDGKRIVFARQSVRSPVDLYSAGTKGDRIKRLTEINAEVLAGLEMNPVEEFWFEGAEGARVHGMIVKPPFFEEGRRYPLILLIHGGPQGSFGDDFHYRWNAQMFASPGYVVAMINPRGSTGYGQKFTDEISGDWGGKAYTDLMNGVDYLLATFPFIDGNRMAAAGASYGGYMVNWIEGHSDRFACLVSHAGVYNLTSMY
jgi:dipeptidyl aminopeptidase/acylaminoacyl peptidase